MAFKLKRFSGFKLNDKEDKYPTKPYSGPKVVGGAVPFTGGGKGKLISKTFGKIAKRRGEMNKTIQKLLEKKGRIFKSSPKSKGRGNL